MNLAVFTSANARQPGAGTAADTSSFTATLPVFAIGKATARALAEYGIRHCRTPGRGADSEALLALPELQAVAGKGIVIFRAKAGGKYW